MKILKVPIDIRFDRKKRSDSEHHRDSVNNVNSDLVRNIKDWESNILNVLSFRKKNGRSKSVQTWNEFAPIFQHAFIVWREIPHERIESEKADDIIAAYLQQGKIKDYLEFTSKFTERIKSMDDPDKVRFMAYNNYFFFLQRFIWDMKEKSSNVDRNDVPTLQNMDADTVAWFIHDECETISFIRDVPKAYEAVKRLKEGLEIGVAMTSQQIQDKKSVALCVDILSQRVPKEDFVEMERIDEILRERILTMRNNIRNATALFEAIDKCFTDEWFDSVNPEYEGCMINAFSMDELEEFYKEKIDEFRAIISKIEI